MCLRDLLQELLTAWPLAQDAQEEKEWCSEAGALHSVVEKAAQHLAPEISNLVTFQPVDINNLQFMLC